MLRDVVWSDDGMYKVGDVYNPERFFSDALNNSSEFDLQLGYFSSATISVLATAFASFISKGGKIRLVINQIVSSKDKESITKGLGESPINCVDLSDFYLLRETFDEYQEQFFNCLAFMIRNKTIDIRIIKPKLTNGIAHTKSGQFRDGDSVTSFIGSANFTLGGLFTNLEEIKIDRSDSLDKMTQKRIQNQKKDFDAIMAREKKDIEYLSPDALIAAIRTYSDVKEIDELLDVELKLKEIKKGKKASIVIDTNVPCYQQVLVVIMHPFVMEMCAGNLSECFLKQFQGQILVLSPVVFPYCQKQHVIVIQSHIALVFEMAIMMLQQPISRAFSFSFPLFTSLSYASCTNLYAGESYPIP